jgi:hypothetical protein
VGYVAYRKEWPQGLRPENKDLDSLTQEDCFAHIRDHYPSFLAAGVVEQLGVETVFSDPKAWESGNRVSVCIVVRTDKDRLDGPPQDEIDAATKAADALAR